MDSLSVIAAKAALVHYARLPDRGKPSLENDEFSVLSAMVGIELGDKGDETCRQPVATVFSMATGTKCCGQGLYTQADCDGNIVCDSHSEVLAHRGFSRYLSKCLTALRSGDSDAGFAKRCILEPCTVVDADAGEKQQYCLKKNWHIFLYISDNPCGDASIYARKAVAADVAMAADATASASSVLNFTGAKLVNMQHNVNNKTKGSAIDDGSCIDRSSAGEKRKRTAVPEPVSQQLGMLRTKSGRSDIAGAFVSESMSCSDKVCRWAHMGLQGALLAPWMQHIPLTGVVVDGDPSAVPGAQEEALRRSLVERTQNIYRSPCQLCLSKEAGAEAGAELVAAMSCLACFPSVALQVHVVQDIEGCTTFSRGKSACEHIIRISNATGSAKAASGSRDKLLPCGVSMNWVRDVVRCDAHLETVRTKHQCADYMEMPITVLPHVSVREGEDMIVSSSRPRVQAARSRSSRLIWTQGGTLEITLAQAGALLGTTKKAIGSRETSSRLCRRDAATLLLSAEKSPKNANTFKVEVEAEGEGAAAVSRTMTYIEMKRVSALYTQRKEYFLSQQPFSAWLIDEDAIRSAFVL